MTSPVLACVQGSVFWAMSLIFRRQRSHRYMEKDCCQTIVWSHKESLIKALRGWDARWSGGSEVCNGVLTPASFRSLGYLFPSRYLATLTKLRQRQWQQNITVTGEEDDSNKVRWALFEVSDWQRFTCRSCRDSPCVAVVSRPSEILKDRQLYLKLL